MSPSSDQRAAEFYAQTYDESVPVWPGEIGFYRNLASEVRSRAEGLLELASGTGRVARSAPAAPGPISRPRRPPFAPRPGKRSPPMAGWLTAGRPGLFNCTASSASRWNTCWHERVSPWKMYTGFSSKSARRHEPKYDLGGTQTGNHRLFVAEYPSPFFLLPSYSLLVTPSSPLFSALCSLFSVLES